MNKKFKIARFNPKSEFNLETSGLNLNCFQTVSATSKAALLLKLEFVSDSIMFAATENDFAFLDCRLPANLYLFQEFKRCFDKKLRQPFCCPRWRHRPLLSRKPPDKGLRP
jgi:hypothetical protein